MRTTPLSVLLLLKLFFGAAPSQFAAATLNDLGLQQVVETKTKNFGGNFGYQFEVLGRSNPFYIDGPVGKAAKASLITNKAFAVGQFGNYSFGTGAMRHNLGIVYDRTSYLPELLEVFNHDTKTVFLDNVYLHSLSWTFRAGLRGVLFANTNDGSTAYKGWSPYVSAGRLFRLSQRQHLLVGLRQSWTFSKTPDFSFIPDEESRLDHLSTSLSLDHSWRFSEAWTLRTRCGFKRSAYSTGSNHNRKDSLLNIGTSLDWAFSDYFSTSAFLAYSNRGSNQGKYAFRNLDGGLRFNASLGF